MATVNSYLTFNGNCEEVFTFYKSVFGGEFPYVGHFKEFQQAQDCYDFTKYFSQYFYAAIFVLST